MHACIILPERSNLGPLDDFLVYFTIDTYQISIYTITDKIYQEIPRFHL